MKIYQSKVGLNSAFGVVIVCPDCRRVGLRAFAHRAPTLSTFAHTNGLCLCNWTAWGNVSRMLDQAVSTLHMCQRTPKPQSHASASVLLQLHPCSPNGFWKAPKTTEIQGSYILVDRPGDFRNFFGGLLGLLLCKPQDHARQICKPQGHGRQRFLHLESQVSSMGL